MARRPITTEIATTRKDIDIFAGWTVRLENPDPVLRTEAGGRGLALYDEVARDAHAASVLQTRYLSVAGREWEVLPASDAAEDQALADMVQEALEGCNMSLAIQELMEAVLYGFAVSEIMWAPVGGRWVPRVIVGKHPRRFVFDHDRELKMLTPANMVTGEALPERKFIHFAWGNADNPYGRGLGQRLWWPVWFKKHGIRWWMVFLEKFGAPTPVGKYPPGTDPDQQQALLDAIEAIQTETGIKIPETMQIDLLEASRSGQAGYDKLCEYMDRQISKCVLGQTATTEGTVGKLGNEEAQQEVRQDIRKADADLLCECLNSTLIRWIVDYNAGPQAQYPKLWIRAGDEDDLNARAARDKILLVDMGMARRVPESYLTDTYGIPLAEGDEPTMGRPEPEPQPIGAPPQPPGQMPPDGRFSETGRDVTPIDQLADRMELETAPLWEAVLDNVRALVERADSLEQLRDGLLAAYADLPTDQLAEVMALGFAAADLAGRYDVEAERNG